MKTVLDCQSCDKNPDTCDCACLSSGVCAYCSGSGVYENEYGNLFDCSACEGTGRFYGSIDLAAAPVPDSALASSGVAAPVAYYVVVVDGLYLAKFNPVRLYQFELTDSIKLARRFRTSIDLKYLDNFTDYLDSISHSYEVQIWRDSPIQEQSK